jgi:hypothetical protein
MSLDTRFAVNSPKVILETFDDEVMLVNLENGNYYSLEKVGAVIWGLLEQGRSSSEVQASVVQQYDGERLELEHLTARFIEELAQEDLIIPIAASQEVDQRGFDTSLPPQPDMPKAHFAPPVLHKFTDMQGLLLLDPIHEVDETGWPMQPRHRR